MTAKEALQEEVQRYAVGLRIPFSINGVIYYWCDGKSHKTYSDNTWRHMQLEYWYDNPPAIIHEEMERMEYEKSIVHGHPITTYECEVVAGIKLGHGWVDLSLTENEKYRLELFSKWCRQRCLQALDNELD